MVHRLKAVYAQGHRQLGHQSMIFAAAFIVTLIVGIFFGSDGLLEYFKVFRGASTTTLEAGAILILASAIPFIGMGMAIGAMDEAMANQRR